MTDPNLVVFLTVTFVLGFILILTTVNARKKLGEKCAKGNVNNTLNFILMLSVMLIILPFTQVICINVCDCDTQSNLWYKSIIGCIGIVLAICGGIIWQEAKKCAADDVSSYGAWLMFLGCIVPLALVTYNYDLVTKLFNHSKSSYESYKSKSQDSNDSNNSNDSNDSSVSNSSKSSFGYY